MATKKTTPTRVGANPYNPPDDPKVILNYEKRMAYLRDVHAKATTPGQRRRIEARIEKLDCDLRQLERASARVNDMANTITKGNR